MSARRALALTYLDRYASLVVSFVASVLIARLLTPADMGAFSIAMVLVSFLGPFRDLGATQYVVRAPALTHDILLTVRSIQLVLGVLLGVGTALASPWVSTFYEDPRIRDVLLLLSLNSLFLPLGALSSALLTRELRAGDLAITRFAGAIVGSTISVFLAWRGNGPFSLAIGTLSGTLTTSLLAISLRPLRLGFGVSFGGGREVLSFGGGLTAANLLTMAHHSTPELALGRLQSLAVSGLYGRAQSLASMLERILMEGAYAIGVPLFAAAIRDGRSIAELYTRAICIVSAAGWTLFGLLYLTAEPVIHVLYGDQWAGAAPILQALCVYFAFWAPNLLFNQPLIAIGRLRIVIRASIAAALLQAAMVIPAAAHSLIAACGALMMVSALLCVGYTITIVQELKLPLRHLARTQAHSALLAAGALLPPLLLRLFGAPLNLSALAIVALSFAACAAGFIGTAWLTRHPIASEVRRFRPLTKTVGT